MRIRHYEDPLIAETDTDEPGRCIAEWIPLPDAPKQWQHRGVKTDGWIGASRAHGDGEDLLFLPRNGDGTNEEHFRDGEPDKHAGWYVAHTGETAIVGVPGAVLAAFFSTPYSDPESVL